MDINICWKQEIFRYTKMNDNKETWKTPCHSRPLQVGFGKPEVSNLKPTPPCACFHSFFSWVLQFPVSMLHTLINISNQNHRATPMDLTFNQPEWWYQSLLDGKHALDFLNSTIKNGANLVSGLRLRRFNFTDTTPNFEPLPVDESYYEIYGKPNVWKLPRNWQSYTNSKCEMKYEIKCICLIQAQ